MTSNPRFIFAKRPETLPLVGEHIVLDKSRTTDLENIPLNGGFLTKMLFISPEPALRERMQHPSEPSFTTTLILGAPIIGFGLVTVLRSEKEGIKAGDLMFGQTPWEMYTVQPYIEGRVDFKPEEWAPHTFDMDALALQVVPNPKGAFPLSNYCNLLGTPGATAFVAFEALGKVKEGETIYVSSGASGVGSMIIQLAKAKGMKVIASAGSDAKVEYMKSIGADFTFNYKTEGYRAPLAKFGPFDLYWDNVGGKALEAALEAIVPFGRIICCGVSGDYGVPFEKRYGIKNAIYFFSKRLTVNGYIIPDFLPQFGPRFFTEIPALLAQGKLKSKEHIIEGFENAGQVLIDTLKGYSEVGKPVVRVVPESELP